MRRIPALLPGLALLLGAAVAPASASRFADRIDLPHGFAPEGVTSKGTTLYVGSLVDGAIWRGSLTTGTGTVWIPGVAGEVAVGIDYEAPSDRLWVAGGPTGEVRVYDGVTADLLRTYTFDSGFLNDLVVTPDAVYVTDSNLQQLIVIPLGDDGALPPEGMTIPLTGDIAYQAGFNANGITAARGWLLLVQSNTGFVFRVDPSTGETSRIALSGASGAYLVTAGDGIEIRGSTLAVVRNQRNTVATFKVNGQLTAGTLSDELVSGGFSVPTTATWAAGDLWAVNARFGTPPTSSTAYWIQRVPGS